MTFQINRTHPKDFGRTKQWLQRSSALLLTNHPKYNMILTIIIVKIVEIISGSEFWKVDSSWLLGNIPWKLVYFLPDVSIVVSIGSLLLISIDRLFAAVSPLKAKLINSKVRLISILNTWFVAIAFHAPYFYSFKLILFFPLYGAFVEFSKSLHLFYLYQELPRLP